MSTSLVASSQNAVVGSLFTTEEVINEELKAHGITPIENPNITTTPRLIDFDETIDSLDNQKLWVDEVAPDFKNEPLWTQEDLEQIKKDNQAIYEA